MTNYLVNTVGCRAHDGVSYVTRSRIVNCPSSGDAVCETLGDITPQAFGPDARIFVLNLQTLQAIEVRAQEVHVAPRWEFVTVNSSK